MSKAIAPSSMPELGEAIEWRRSTRKGSVYHAHKALGETLCGSIHLDRHKSEAASSLGDLQYWGCCPRCIAKGKAA